MDEGEWQERVKALLKAELKRRRTSYGDLRDKLAAMGVKASVATITNKLSRGSFSAVFFVQCLVAIGCQSLRLDDIEN